MVVRAALRFGFGTASLLAGSWVLRALHGAPAALGASPAEIEAVARRSPNYRDGVFVNLEPASGISLDREEQRQIIWDLIGSRGKSRPSGPIPRRRACPPNRPRRRFRSRWFGHSSALIEVDGYRVLADPDLESTAARRRRPWAPSGCTRYPRRWRRCPRSMR